LVAAAVPTSHAAEQYVGRTYEGESKAGDLQEAMDAALKSLSDDLAEGGVADALANWKLSEVTGQLGGVAGFRSVKVRIVATRTPPNPKKG
jgi:hypothetical protein